MFHRRILHHGPDPTAPGVPLQDRAVVGCWFELHRLGGCGAGELILRDGFPDRDAVDLGDWVSLEAAPGERWYLGRVKERRAQSPAEVRLRLEGMSTLLAEVFPGGFDRLADGVPPHRFAATDLFPFDPDHSLETCDSAADAAAVVRLLLERYVLPATPIVCDPAEIEPPLYPAAVTSLKFRGEESTREIIQELALRAQAAWGVDAQGRFYFRQASAAVLATWREGRDLTSLHETRDREHLFNRVLLTGDYVYDRADSSAQMAQRSYRWRGNYTEPASRALHGDRRIRLWLPWLRTEADSIAFVREFFRTYAQPTSRYLIETLPQSALPLPWAGRIRLESRDGAPLATAAIESLRVAFDHAPWFRLEVGPADPRRRWPAPPQDERWELPTGRAPGGAVEVTEQPPLTSRFETFAVSLSDGASNDTTGSSDFSSETDRSDSDSDDAGSGDSGDVSSDEDSSRQSSDDAQPSSSGFDSRGVSSDVDSGDDPSSGASGTTASGSSHDAPAPSSNETDSDSMPSSTGWSDSSAAEETASWLSSDDDATASDSADGSSPGSEAGRSESSRSESSRSESSRSESSRSESSGASESFQGSDSLAVSSSFSGSSPPGVDSSDASSEHRSSPDLSSSNGSSGDGSSAWLESSSASGWSSGQSGSDPSWASSIVSQTDESFLSSDAASETSLSVSGSARGDSESGNGSERSSDGADSSIASDRGSSPLSSISSDAADSGSGATSSGDVPPVSSFEESSDSSLSD